MADEEKLKITEELIREAPFDVRLAVEKALGRTDAPCGSDFERVKLYCTIDQLAKRNADLQYELKLMTQNRAMALNLVEESRQRLRKLPELEEALRVEQEAHRRTQRRLEARERELERIRTTLYKDRVEEFVKITAGEEK